MVFDFESLRDILVCPKSKSNLIHDEQSLVCVDSECRLSYEIRDDIPVMLIDEATELSTENWSAIMEKHDTDPVTETAADDEAASESESAEGE